MCTYICIHTHTYTLDFFSLLVVNQLQIEKELSRKDQQLGALTTLPEDPGSIPSTHKAAYNCL